MIVYETRIHPSECADRLVRNERTSDLYKTYRRIYKLAKS